jgi:5-methylthioadenosine/S-adenosylhomocysteine deaminase
VTAPKIAGFPRQLGRLAAGGPADILVLERHDDDPYAAVCRAQRSSVELVAIAGHLLYARDDWFRLLAPNAQLHSRQNVHATGELVWSWGKRMRLDVAAPGDPVGHHPALPGLAGTRAQLLARYTRTGPIFA